MQFLVKTVAICLFLSWASSARGQAPPDTIKTELLTLSINGTIPGYFFRSGNEVQKLEASSDGIGQPIYYEGPRVLLLYGKKTDLNPVPEGETPPKPLHTVKIHEGSNRTLLVFAFTGQNQNAPGIKAYGITDANFGEGDYRIFNFSTQNVYLMFNEEKLVVPPGKEGDIRGSKWGKNVQDMKVLLGKKDGEKLVPVYSSNWGHRPERRCFIFVFDRQDERKRLSIKKFFDVPSLKVRVPKGAQDDKPPKGGF